ncbi:hypothetical protein ACFU51_28370 [Streptomyces sp. NPDC057430]|uniref:hypothetical protein n=1 Tax=Streptomyces sp. NPDC057430 TaxID=3346131 RepID=UPI0036749EFA
MRRYLYRCTVCRTTSPVCFGTAELEAESDHHRDALHSGHYPDGERIGEVDRNGRWYADMRFVIALHTRLADNLADIRDPKGHGARLWAWALSWLTLGGAGYIALWAMSIALTP